MKLARWHGCAGIALVAALLALALAWLGAGRSGAREPSGERAEPNGAHAETRLEAAPAGAAREAIAPVPSDPVAVAAHGPEPFSMPALVRGRVIDSLGRAVADARVELAQSMDFPERHRQDPDWLLRSEGAVQARTTTDARGEFALEARALRSECEVLVVTADPMLARLVHPFALAPVDRLLAAGDQDLGELVLVPAGVIRGRFVDEGAQFGEHVSVSARRHQALVPVVRSELDASGEFELPHCEPGEHEVEASAGWLTAAEVYVQVEPGRVSWVELRSPKRTGPIRGHVIKRVPDPLTSLRVWGRPSDSARTVSTPVRSDRTFELELQVDELHELVVGRGEKQPDWTFYPRLAAPGEREVYLSISDRSELEIVAVDAQTGATIPRFTFGIEHVSVGAEAMVDSLTPAGADGRSVLSVERGDRGTLLCLARGYLPFKGPIQRDADDASRMTVHLTRGASIGGRVLGARHQQVLLRRANLGKESPRRFSDWSYDVSGFLAPQQRAVGDEQGAFVLRGLPAGTFELVIHGEHGMLRLSRVRIEHGEQHELGELELEPYASLVGRVECTGAPCPSGLFVELEGQPRRGALVRPDGSFRLDGIEAGRRIVLLKDYARAEPQLAQFAVELDPGELELVQWTLALD